MKGFLMMRDGTLVPWKPNQEPDPLLVAMHKLDIGKKKSVNKTEDEMIDELVKSYVEKIESEKK